MRDAEAEFVDPPLSFRLNGFGREFLGQGNGHALATRQGIDPRRRRIAQRPDLLLHLANAREQRLFLIFGLEDLLDRVEVIAQTLKCLGPEQRLANRAEAALLHRPQSANQVSVVDRRDESGLHRVQRPVVVPVVHLAFVARHLVDRIKRSFGVRQKFRQCQEAEVHRREPRIQKETEICRRNAMNDQAVGLHDRVRNHEVLFCSAVFTEQPPGTQRRMPQQFLIFGFDLCVRLANRQIKPLLNWLRKAPQNQEWQRNHERCRTLECDDHANEERDPRSQLQVGLDRRLLAVIALRFRRRLPFEKSLVSHGHANDRANDRVNRHQRLMA